jgi:hypothetical protein
MSWWALSFTQLHGQYLIIGIYSNKEAVPAMCICWQLCSPAVQCTAASKAGGGNSNMMAVTADVRCSGSISEN